MSTTVDEILADSDPEAEELLLEDTTITAKRSFQVRRSMWDGIQLPHPQEVIEELLKKESIDQKEDNEKEEQEESIHEFEEGKDLAKLDGGEIHREIKRAASYQDDTKSVHGRKTVGFIVPDDEEMGNSMKNPRSRLLRQSTNFSSNVIQDMLSEMLKPENLEMDTDDHTTVEKSEMVFHALDVNTILNEEDIVDEETPQSVVPKAGDENVNLLNRKQSDKGEKGQKKVEVVHQETDIEKARRIEQESVKPAIDLVSPLRRASDLSNKRGSLTLNDRALLSCKVMENASAILEKACERGAKRPTVVLNHSKFIAIGTETGYVILLDHFQNVSQVISCSNSCVTALDMPDDSQILIFGDSSGNLTIWDVENKKEIKTFEKLIDNGIQSVISLSRSEKFRLLITTSKGQIYCVTISKIFFAYTADKKVLLNGAYGLITSLKFNIPNSNMDHPLDAMELYAFSTWDTVYIIRNENQHIDTLDRPPHVKRGAPADISWKYRSIDFNSLNLKNSSYIEQDFFAHPVLAISWGNMLFIKVYTLRDGSNHADAKFVGTFTMPFIIKAVSWLSGKLLSVISDEDKLIAVDALNGQIVETVPLLPARIFDYDVPFSNSGDGSVIETNFIKTYHRSISSASRTALILAENSLKPNLFCLNLRAWDDFLESLISSGYWIDALKLALEFWDGTSKIDVQLPKQNVLGEKVMIYLNRFLDYSFRNLPKDSPHYVYSNRLIDIAAIAVDFCCTIKKLDGLKEIYQKFKLIHSEQFFMSSIDALLLNGSIDSLSNYMIKEFIEYMISNQMAKRKIEGALMNLDHKSIDVHFLIDSCEYREMYSAVIYFLSDGLLDFYEPIKRLCTIMKSKDPSDRDYIGLRLLAYIQDCFEGRNFFKSGLLRNPVFTSKICGQIVNGLFGDSEKDSDYSTLCFLIQYRPAFIFDVLLKAVITSIWLEDERNLNEKSTNQKQTLRLPVTLKQNLLPNPQSIFDCLCKIILQRNASLEHLRNEFFAYMCEFACMKEISVPPFVRKEAIQFLIGTVGSVALDNILNLNNSKKEDLILKIIKRYPISDASELEFLIEKAIACKFNALLEFLYLSSNDFFHAYLTVKNDINSVQRSFEFFKWAMIHESVSIGQRELIKAEFLNSITVLMNLNAEITSQILIEFFQDQANVLVERLEEYPAIQLSYLQQLIYISYQRDIRVDDAAKQIVIDNQIVEKYISLLCRFRRQDVYSFLISNENYNLESTTNLVKEHKIYDAAAYLLERTGDLQGALALLLKLYYTSLCKLKKYLDEIGPTSFVSIVKRQEFLGLIKNLDLVTHICDRTSQKKDEAASRLCFCVLDNLLSFRKEFYIEAPLKRLSKKRFSGDARLPNEVIAIAVMECIKLFLLKMKTHIPTREIMDYLSEVGAYLNLADVRNTLSSLFESETFEFMLLSCANRVFESDIDAGKQNLYAKSSKAFVPLSGACVTCGKQVNENLASIKDSNSKSDITVYECGHCYHNACLGKGQNKCILCKHVNKSFSNTLGKFSRKSIFESASQLPKDQLSSTMRKSLFITELSPPNAILDRSELIRWLANQQNTNPKSLFADLQKIKSK